MGAVAVCSARSGCLRRGVVHGDGKGSAGHAGVGLGWQTGKLNFTHGPAALISYSSTSSRKSRVLIEEQDHVVIDQCQSTLQTRRHGVVGLQQGPPELARAARSECILQERRGSTHKQPQCKPWTCPHTWDQHVACPARPSCSARPSTTNRERGTLKMKQSSCGEFVVLIPGSTWASSMTQTLDLQNFVDFGFSGVFSLLVLLTLFRFTMVTVNNCVNISSSAR